MAASPRDARPAPPAVRGQAGFATGIVFYPTSVLLLLLLLPGRPDIVAAAWGIMAAGDGAATLVGRRSRGARIPWNRDKSVAGSVAFVIAGSAAGSFLAWWCRPAVIPPPYVWFSLVAPLVGALAAAAVETVPIKLDDNLSVPSTAALVMWSMSLVSEDLAAAVALPAAARALPLALLANRNRRGCGYAARTVSISGAIVRRGDRHPDHSRSRDGGPGSCCWLHSRSPA